MNQAELEAIPITDKVMFGSDMVWDDHGEKWWIGEIDGKPHRRPFGPQFSTATFTVSHGERREKVSIPFLGETSDRLPRAAAEWGAKEFGCDPSEVEVSASS